MTGGGGWVGVGLGGGPIRGLGGGGGVARFGVGGSGWGGGVKLGGDRVDVNGEVFFRGGSGQGGGGRVGGCQGGWERRIEALLKIPKKNWGGGGVGFGVRVDVNRELKFL